MQTLQFESQSIPLHRQFRKQHDIKDELKKVQQTFDEIHNFDSRPLELRIRQIRLDRLTKRIKESLSSNTDRNRKEKKPKEKSEIEARFEHLEKAKQLGKEYSRLNACIPRAVPSNTINENCEIDKEKMRLIKRNMYGKSVVKLLREKTCRPSKVLKSEEHLSPNNVSRNKLLEKPCDYIQDDNIEFNNVPRNSSEYLEDITVSKESIYRNTVEAIIRESERSQCFENLMYKALKGIPNDLHETYKTRTKLISNCHLSNEVLERTYRYSVSNSNNVIEPTDTCCDMPKVCSSEKIAFTEYPNAIEDQDFMKSKKVTDSNTRYIKIKDAIQHTDG